MSKGPPQLTRGLVFGRWKLIEWLGHGGNGQVWLAADETGAQVAIKLLLKVKKIAYARFRAEVAVIEKHQDIPGIVRIIDHSLPDNPDLERPWYTMPVANRAIDKLQHASPAEIANAFIQIAKTLTALHKRDVAHRDIKPANLLALGGQFLVGDFGLVDYPEKEDLTEIGEELGPRWTMAPEVRRDGAKAKPKPADVYSLVKTLWIFLTKVEKGFEGQYNSHGTIKLAQYLPSLYITDLEKLFVDCTEHDPTRRPTMDDVANRLEKWVSVIADYRVQNPLQWIEAQKVLFPLELPTRAIWEDVKSIVSVLDFLGNVDNLNHMLFPRSGGLDLERASISREDGCIELLANDLITIVKPKRLMFESFENEPEWCYFRLETGDLVPSGIYPDLEPSWCEELLTEIDGQTYADYSCWEAGEYESLPLPENSRVVKRVFRGDFVIFQKTSLYNMNPDTYDGRHNKMSADAFRTHIKEVIQYLSEQKKRTSEERGKTSPRTP